MEQRMPGGGLLGSSRAKDDVRVFAGFFVGAGLVNATIAALLLCRLPESHVPSLRALILRATAYVLLSAAAGIAGAYFYWRRASRFYHLHAPMAFMEYALVCAAGWVWVPAAVLLSTQDSRATALTGALGGLLLGVGLRKGIPPEEDSGARHLSVTENEMFAATLQSVPREVRGYVIAGLIYAAGYAQHDGMHLLAGLLCAAAAFLFAWNWMQPSRDTADCVRRDAGQRLALAGPLAILVTAWALLLGVAHRNASVQAAYAAGRESDQRSSPREPSLGAGGFESVILWPFPPKKQIIPPLPAPRNYLGMEKSRPLTIRFDGAYWYFQPPETQPGRTAHQAHGTPLTANIQSVNTLPLMMEAHQRLIGPVRLSRCGEIDVQIQNRDNLPGPLSIALLLGDSQFPSRPGLYLGKKEVETSLPGFFYYKPAPVFETVRFAIPAAASLRKFDQITVLLLPEIAHSTVAPKIAIEQFELFPR
jgi:hypothetical protein